MSRDNWERLVVAVIRREQIRELFHDQESSCSSSRSLSSFSDHTVPTFIEDINPYVEPSAQLRISQRGNMHLSSNKADSSITFLLRNVNELFVYYRKLAFESENKLRLLKNELELMKVFLKHDSAQYKYNGRQIREVVERQIRKVVYRAEDTIDNYETVAPNSRISLTKRIDLAKQVKHLRDMVKPMLDPIIQFNFDLFQITDAASVSSTVQHTRDLSKKTPFLRLDNIVGFEDEADTLIGYLTEYSNELEVISIIGMAGLGKTTMAWKISHDPKIQQEFPTIIWVSISQEFNWKDLLLNIIIFFNKNDMSGKNGRELARIARSYLETGKFLLFLDDVWTIGAWNIIQTILPKTNEICKVLITSRDMLVGLHANPKREPHKLRFLTSEGSWELLKYEVVGKLDECPEDLESLGMDIAEKCGGLPLAIVIIGGILLEKYSNPSGVGTTKEEWQKVSDSLSSYFHYDKVEQMEHIISLSCNELPYDLISCFLYLGIFPENYEIPAWKLTRLWIAEGFIKPRLPERTLEEIAEDNLKELICRNLVMVDKMKPGGGVKTCRVHGMIREFCKHGASHGVHNLFQEIKMSNGDFEPQVSDINNYRRLCIHSYVRDFLSRYLNAPFVRSFFCFSKEAINLPLQNVSTLPKAFSLLRVLDVVPIKFPKFPTKLTSLLHLRYIALAGDEFKVLPEAISKLRNVQTIIVETISHTLEIKADISKMMQLRHLKTKASIILSKEGESKGGENLQTLGRLSPECCIGEVFDRTPNLKILGIRGKLAILLDSNCLTKLRCLEKLRLVNDVFPAHTSENPLIRLPQPDRFPPNLRNLTLSATYLDWKYMSSVLGKLDRLVVLKLKENAFTGTLWDDVGGGFGSLEFLQIERTDLRIWTVSSDSFPKLRCLVLKKCEKLEEVPFGLVKSLHKLEMERVSESAVESARKIEEEKKRNQGPQVTERVEFKLIIAPGDQ